MTNKKEGSVIPEEYVVKKQELSVEDWRKQMVDAALKFMAERKKGADVPSWWQGEKDDPYFSEKYGVFNDCLATSTGAFGDKYNVPGNQSFINPKSNGYFAKKGFREVEEGEEDQYGDIWVEYSGDTPYHALMLTGHNENGVPLFTYGRGLSGGPMAKNKTYPLDFIKKKYRFVGTEDDLAELEAHNAMARKWQEMNQPLKTEITKAYQPRVDEFRRVEPKPVVVETDKKKKRKMGENTQLGLKRFFD